MKLLGDPGQRPSLHRDAASGGGGRTLLTPPPSTPQKRACRQKPTPKEEAPHGGSGLLKFL